MLNLNTGSEKIFTSPVSFYFFNDLKCKILHLAHMCGSQYNSIDNSSCYCHVLFFFPIIWNIPLDTLFFHSCMRAFPQ